jgi:hypothetical protein
MAVAPPNLEKEAHGFNKWQLGLDRYFSWMVLHICKIYAVVFQQPQYAIDVGCASDSHSIFGQFIHGGAIACEPVPVGEIETIAPCLEKV